MIAMFSKNNKNTCTTCGKIGHIVDKCWTIEGILLGTPNIRENKEGKANSTIPRKLETTTTKGFRNGTREVVIKG